MNFLNPSALIALLAGSLPVIIHFINLRKLKKIEFSSLAFLKELQKTKIKRIKIKQWILLVLRVLIIVSIVLAFSKPVLNNSASFFSNAHSAGVIIIDNSFSMSAPGKEGTLLNMAKQSAKRVLNTFKTDDEIYFIRTCGAEISSPLKAENVSAVRKMIDDTEISIVGESSVNSLIKGITIAGESSAPNKEIYIFSDFQKNSLIYDSLNLSRHDFPFSKYMRVYTFKQPLTRFTNLTATNLKLSNSIIEIGKPVSFSASIANYSQRNAENAVASLFINGRRAAQQGINLAAGESRQISFETALNEPGFLNVSLELEDDDINYDNKRYLGLYLPEKLKITAFAEMPTDLEFVSLAIESFSSKSLQLETRYINQIPSADLSRNDLIIICGTPGESGIKPLKQYLENGKSIIVFPGSRTTMDEYNRFASGLGIPGCTGIFNYSDESQGPRIEKYDFQHPVISGLFEPGSDRDYSNKILSPSFLSFIKINNLRGLNIIEFHDQSPFLAESKISNGKVLQFGIAPIPSWSDFPFKAIFAPLLHRIVSYLSLKQTDLEDLIAGRALTIHPMNRKNTIKAQLPDNSTFFIKPNYEKGEILRFSQTYQPGIYKFFEENNLIHYSSLNFDPGESIIDNSGIDIIKDVLSRYNMAGNINNIESGTNIEDEIEKSRLGIELWRYFVLLALIFASAEMILARTAKNEISGISENYDIKRN